MDIGAVGIWSGRFRVINEDAVRRHAKLIEELGFHALWIPGGGAFSLMSAVRAALEVTSGIAVASAILNVWFHSPGDVARVYHELDEQSKGRCVLGLGVSHPAVVNSQSSKTYGRPLSKMTEYLGQLDSLGVRRDDRILAALGPNMLDLARDCAAGAHPYCTTVGHTTFARERLGPDALLAPGIKVIFESDPDRARQIARSSMSRYVRLESYANNFLRLGFTPEDLAHGGSDRLIDEVVGWGSGEEVASYIHAYLVAGADHVAIQVLHDRPEEFPVTQWQMLATVLADLL